jgi:hypothetical protein
VNLSKWSMNNRRFTAWGDREGHDERDPVSPVTESSSNRFIEALRIVEPGLGDDKAGERIELASRSIAPEGFDRAARSSGESAREKA